MGHDLLPTNAKIASVNQAFDRSCPRCKTNYETLIQALRDCICSKNVLTHGCLDDRLLNSTWNDGVDWLEGAMRLLDKKAFECLLIVLWNIWNSRNNLLFRCRDEDPKIIWDRVVAFCQEFRLYNLTYPDMLHKSIRERKWSKHSVGTVKVNFDAAWKDGKADTGFLGRDTDGFVVGVRWCLLIIWLMRPGLKRKL